MKTTLSLWRGFFQSLDKCPWPGPRPLNDSETDRGSFVGRKQDSSDFVNRVKKHRLVILSGESGAGKSSLLNTRLVEDLRKSGYRVLVCRKWSDPHPDSPDKEADSFMRRILGPEAILQGCPLDAKGETVFEQLDQLAYKKVVLVLDQFEHLIRHQPAMFRKVSSWILDANKRTELKIVLSLRLEFVTRLRQIERDAAPYSISTKVLEPLRADEDIQEIISSDKAGTSQYIEKEAANRIFELWRESARAPGMRWNSIGPLHLQATQYALYFAAKGDAGSDATPIIQIRHVRAMEEAAAERVDASGAALTLFDYGLRKAVEAKLENCKRACESRDRREAAGFEDQPSMHIEGCDTSFVQGALALAYRIVPQLSSGGYKLEREAWDLARMTLGAELTQLIDGAKLDGKSRSIDHEAAALVHEQLLHRTEKKFSGEDLLTVGRAEIKRSVDHPGFNPQFSEPTLAAKEEGIDVLPWEADPQDVTAGPMLGMFPGDVLIEELRRLVFAQCWLEEAMLIQASPAGGSRRMLELIHDGFADALESWARRRRSDAGAALHLLTAAKGRTLDWLGRDTEPLPLRNESREHEVFVNLRWKDCQVTADFVRIVFVNCDFRGTGFRGCRFEGVVFVNCLMDNVTFEGCTIVGGTSTVIPNPDLKDDRLPAFRVCAKRATVDELTHYRELQVEQGGRPPELDLFSRTSGLSAMPWRNGFVAKHDWCLEDHGLSMFGGRLSSLMVRACHFVDGGTLALRFIAGSSLDVVEASDCAIDIVQSAIRGLTVTKAVDSPATPKVSVSLNDCVVANCWFGANLQGRSEFQNCQVYQLCTLSDPRLFDIDLCDSLRVGVTNDFIGTLARLPMPPEPDEVLKKLKAMDFRTYPARLEFGIAADVRVDS
ncbi:pentapeptide repeat-containing protein [Ideonella sp. 4Y16]|uniref:nSTAND1 domain-containing NTPase n=1 Tax=Ideonella alba TaxID=2824118 RepID=UPI001B372B24|nr:pentapeptide repeat-containing protein [Ideonella alba]MBQ0944023.1 pentapeptide repeat-containing protein [Ideonella alba]